MTIWKKDAGNQRGVFAGLLILLVLAIVLGVTGFLNQRELEREEGTAHGYTAGYSIGDADYLNGREQNAQKLAGEIVPYTPGTGKWKFFIMGFTEGYAQGLSGENTWNISAS